MAKAKRSPDSAGRTVGGRFVAAMFGLLIIIVSAAFYLPMLQAGKHGSNVSTIIAFAFWSFIGFLIIRSSVRKVPAKP